MHQCFTFAVSSYMVVALPPTPAKITFLVIYNYPTPMLPQVRIPVPHKYYMLRGDVVTQLQPTN